MSFETAKDISFIIHMVFILSVFGTLLLIGWRKVTPTKMMYKLYFCILIWYVICRVFDGCPLTYLENYISFRIYGSTFYPDYDFNKSIVSVFVKNPSNYIPLFIVIAYQLITFSWRSRIESRRNL